MSVISAMIRCFLVCISSLLLILKNKMVACLLKLAIHSCVAYLSVCYCYGAIVQVTSEFCCR